MKFIFGLAISLALLSSLVAAQPCVLDSDCVDAYGCTDDYCCKGVCVHEPNIGNCYALAFPAPLGTCVNTLTCTASGPAGSGCGFTASSVLGAPCVPSDYCLVNGVCQGQPGPTGPKSCVSNTPRNCQDTVPCTISSCDSLARECVQTGDDSQCPNTDECTVGFCEPCEIGSDADGCVYDNICTPTATATRTPSRTPSSTPSATITPSRTPSTTSSATRTPSATMTSSQTRTPSSSATPTSSNTATPSNTPTSSSTGTQTPSATSSPVPASASPTPSSSATATSSQTPTSSATQTGTPSPSSTSTGTSSPSSSQTPSASVSPSEPPCQIDCAYSQGYFANRSPCSNKGNQETDPIWFDPDVQSLHICGYTLCEVLQLKGNSKKDNLRGSALALARTWIGVFLNLASQDEPCSGPQPAYVDMIYDNAEQEIFNNVAFCGVTELQLYNDWADVLGDWQNGNYQWYGGPPHCNSSDSSSLRRRQADGADDPYDISGDFTAGDFVPVSGCIEAAPSALVTQLAAPWDAVQLCPNADDTVRSVIESAARNMISVDDERFVLAAVIVDAHVTGGYLAPVYVQRVYEEWAVQGCAVVAPAEFVAYIKGEYCMLDGPCLCGSTEQQQNAENTPYHVNGTAQILEAHGGGHSQQLPLNPAGLSVGAIVGIVLGSAAILFVVVAIISVLIAIAVIYRRRRNANAAPPGSVPLTNDDEDDADM